MRVLEENFTKWVIILALVCFISHASFAQVEFEAARETSGDKSFKNGYISLLGLVAIPQSTLKEYSNVRGGFSIEVGKYFSDHSPFSFGGDFSMLFSSAKKDVFKGLDIETSSLYVDLQPHLRWSPTRSGKVYPYFTASAGMALVNTQTTSEIVDKPTFIEELLFGQEEEVDVTSHQNNTSANFAYGFGGGLIVAKHVNVGLRYQKVRPVDYVDKNEVHVSNGELVYEKHKIPLDMLIVTIGLTIN